MSGLTRREAILGVSAAAAMSTLPASARQDKDKQVAKKGRLKQAVAYWCFKQKGVKLKALCKASAEMGIKGIDILSVKDWKIAAEYGLVASVGRLGASGQISKGLNDPKYHDAIVKDLEKGIPLAKAAGVPNVVCFFGKRNKMKDRVGIKNSIDCLNRVKSLAEENGVTIVVELLNSIVNHPGYIGDKTPYCVKIMKGVNSPNVKILYDIYHAQIMEGNIIETIRKNHKWIGHYHTAGVPGRHELDENQELNYPAIARAVVETGYKGFFAHEFVPIKDDPIQSLRDAVALCDV